MPHLESEIDQLIEKMDFLTKSETVMPKPTEVSGNPNTPEASKTKADEALPSATASETAGTNGRPEEDHENKDGEGDESEDDSNEAEGATDSPDGAQKDVDKIPAPKKTKEAKGYDSIQRDAALPGEETTIAKAQGLSAEDAALLKAAKAAKADELRKAQAKQTADLVKSQVAAALKPLQDENSSLKKSINEMKDLLKGFGRVPRQQKSITSVAALEKSFGGSSDEDREFSKAEKLDACEALVMKKALPWEALIELEETGSLYNPQHRAAVESELKRPRK